jgi:hypothetical protein
VNKQNQRRCTPKKVKSKKNICLEAKIFAQQLDAAEQGAASGTPGARKARKATTQWARDKTYGARCSALMVV